ncbi:(2E,6E)-farnesyl diphosphate synthase [Pseudoalteromonas fenneropenaei]|uniref:(2E,6E)-farnesyl diphosphate synthase n=1 Tax=Pseudoalteromonas fenneropenaei TaxID=1737459 RepID=A0ABV7CIU1_9GAMM
MNLNSQIHAAKERVESVLNAIFDRAIDSDTKLQAAMHYSLSIGGKRLRPFLLYTTGQIFGAKAADLDVLAAAIECIHTYSLIHDDLPAMDDDELRRGQPTCHIQFDEATAILAGDALQTLAFELIAEHTFAVPAEQVIKMLAVLARASGWRGMAGGQALDIAATGKAVDKQQLEQIHNLKTGALLCAAIELGALCAPQCDEQSLVALRQFGKSLGLAFQVQDDILDIVGDTATLGKPQGSDVALNKSTYPALLGLAGAQTYAKTLVSECIEALKPLSVDTEALALTAHFIIERNH